MTVPPTSGHGRLVAGERVLLVDPRQRRYLTKLEPGARFHTHSGIVSHDDVIGNEEGAEIVASTGRRFIALRPTLSEIVLKMPRGAQVIYPKDLGAILMAADIAPHLRVLEAGVGSGALSMAMLRSGAEVIGYEIREDFARTARTNVAEWTEPGASYVVHERDVYEGIEENDLDRVVLDLPEPWRVIPHAEKAMRPGGVFLAYLPTINQVSSLRSALSRSRFAMAETFELLRRTWHVEERSVRPDHRMVAHTGFLTTARLLAGDATTPRRDQGPSAFNPAL